MEYYAVVRSSELYHHGILGMKWGVRRYQNEDGSLTPAGERRYGTVGKDAKVSRKEIHAERKARTKELTESDHRTERIKTLEKRIKSLEFKYAPTYTDEDSLHSKLAGETILKYQEEADHLIRRRREDVAKQVRSEMLKKYGTKRIRGDIAATTVEAGAVAAAAALASMGIEKAISSSGRR